MLPLSFDAGLSQLTTAFSVGASAVLMDYLLPRDVIRAVARYQVTGLGAVPPLWNQLVGLDWPAEAVQSLRYITNTGGAMPVPTTRALQKALPNTKIFLMYGLTEAFRSTYLPPDQVDTRPESMGKAIPNAEILVVNEHGEECGPGEPGELVHRGALVSMGYWNDPEKTAERFKPCPGPAPGDPHHRAGGLVRRPGHEGRGRLPVLHQPQGRDDQDLRLPGQPHRGGGSGLRLRPGGRGGRPGPAPRHPGPGHRAGGQPPRGRRGYRAGQGAVAGPLPQGTAQFHGAAGGDRPRQPAPQPERQDRPAGAGRRVPDHFPG